MIINGLDWSSLLLMSTNVKDTRILVVGDLDAESHHGNDQAHQSPDEHLVDWKSRFRPLEKGYQ